MSGGVREFFASGRLSRLDATEPVSLKDREAVWYVEQGRMDVFLVKESGAERSERVYCFSVEAGQAALGCGAENGHSLLGVGIPGTSVRRVPRSGLLGLEGQGLAPLVDAHLRNLAEALTRDIEAKPEGGLEAGAGADVALPALSTLRPRGGTVWIRHSHGASLYLGMEGVGREAGWFPLAPGTWTESMGEGTLETADTGALLAQTDFARILDGYHAAALRGLALGATFAVVDRLASLRGKSKDDERVARGGLLRLASVISPKLGLEAARGMVHTDDPLLAACVVAGRHLGMTFSSLPPLAEGAAAADAAEACGMRARRVRLEKDWFRHSSGPMVGALMKDERPVAILPAPSGGYRLHDPVSGESEPVTQAVAHRLSARAYALYRPLPARKLRLFDISRFGLHGCWRDLAWVGGVGAVLGLLGLAVPALTRTIFSDVIPGADRGRLMQMVAILVGFSVAMLLFEVVKTMALLRVRNRAMPSLQAAIWDRLLRLPATFFRKFSTGDLASRAMAVSTVQNLLSGASLNSMSSALFSLIYLGLLFYYDLKLALVALALVLVSGLATSLISLFLMRYQRRAVAVAGKLSGLTLQFITGVSKLRAGGAEERALMLWADAFAEQRRLGYRSGSVSNAFSAFQMLFGTLGSMAIFFGVVVFERETAMDTGTYIAFWAAFGGLQGGVQTLISSAMSLLSAVPHYERMLPILETPPESDRGGSDPGELAGNVEMSRISFRYGDDGPPILRDVSFKAAPGEFLAITGPSGSGKTTLLRLLLGFETPQSGTILYENQDLSHLDLVKVRRQLGVVLQNSGLMSGDIFSNIAGTAELKIEDAWRAAEMAGLDGDIRDMPMGMHTVVAEGGTTLSGGQRQRLLIARALAGKPGILLFDEATSALDNRTQEIVTQSLNRLPVTRIVIAHRLSTIRQADRIIVLDDGVVGESGTYDELIARRGLFYELTKRQKL